jgi:hypothetical protein
MISRVIIVSIISVISHRGINVDHGIHVEQHSKPRNKYAIFALVSWF